MFRDRPNFHTELRSVEVIEGRPVRFETKLTPFGDPELKVDWFFNGKKVETGDFF